jgi:hypothetical protein
MFSVRRPVIRTPAFPCPAEPPGKAHRQVADPTGHDHSGLVRAVPMSVPAIFRMYEHGSPGDWILWGCSWPDWTVRGIAAVILLTALVRSQGHPPRVAGIVGGALAAVLLHRYGVELPDGAVKHLAFNCSYPIGSAVTFALGYRLGRPRRQ